MNEFGKSEYLCSTIKDVIFCNDNVRIELTSAGSLEQLSGKIDTVSILKALVEMVDSEKDEDDIKRISKIPGTLVEFTNDGISVLSIANRENGISIVKSGDNLVVEQNIKIATRRL